MEWGRGKQRLLKPPNVFTNVNRSLISACLWQSQMQKMSSLSDACDMQHILCPWQWNVIAQFIRKSPGSFWDSLILERHCLSICACIWHFLQKQLAEDEPLRISITGTGELLPVSVVWPSWRAVHQAQHPALAHFAVQWHQQGGKEVRLWVGICVFPAAAICHCLWSCHQCSAVATSSHLADQREV